MGLTACQDHAAVAYSPTIPAPSGPSCSNQGESHMPQHDAAVADCLVSPDASAADALFSDASLLEPRPDQPTVSEALASECPIVPPGGTSCVTSVVGELSSADPPLEATHHLAASPIAPASQCSVASGRNEDATFQRHELVRFSDGIGSSATPGNAAGNRKDMAKARLLTEMNVGWSYRTWVSRHSGIPRMACGYLVLLDSVVLASQPTFACSFCRGLFDDWIAVVETKGGTHLYDSVCLSSSCSMLTE